MTDLDRAAAHSEDASEPVSPPPRDLLDDLLPLRPHPKPPGATLMLRLVAYDISDPKRLQRIATICEDYGVRVQYSLFECWLDDDAFERLWHELETTFDPETDRLAAYRLDAGAVRERRKAGDRMVLTNPVRTYVV